MRVIFGRIHGYGGEGPLIKPGDDRARVTGLETPTLTVGEYLQ